MFRKKRRERGFTQIDNRAVLDPRISLKAKGLLVIIMSRPEEWEFSMNWLCEQSRDGLDSTQRAIRELEKAGYVTRVRKRDAQGQFCGWIYEVDDVPQEVPKGPQKDEIDENCDLSRQAENPMSGNRSVGGPIRTTSRTKKSRTPINTELNNNTELNTSPPISPPKSSHHVGGEDTTKKTNRPGTESPITESASGTSSLGDTLLRSRESSAAAPAGWPPDQPESVRRAWASPTGQALLKTLPPDKLWKLHERIERYAQNWTPEEVRAAWKQAKSTAQYRPPLDFFLIILDGKHSLDRSLVESPPNRPAPASPPPGQKVLYDEMEWELVRIVEDTAYLKREDIPGEVPVKTRWLQYA